MALSLFARARARRLSRLAGNSARRGVGRETAARASGLPLAITIAKSLRLPVSTTRRGGARNHGHARRWSGGWCGAGGGRQH
eukprot:365979-Chlamydomonas_euryale.AAC.8